MKYHNQLPVKGLAQKKGTFSERRFANEVGLSRVSLRNLLNRDQNITIKTMVKAVDCLGRNLHVLATSDDTNTELSTLAVGYSVVRDGFDSWKIHFMDFVDEFRRTLDPQLVLLAPPRDLDEKLKALLASIAIKLCEDNGMDAPSWAEKMYFLERPWFVSGMQSLKATAIVESPLPFRRNNIFVLDNFLERA